MSIHIFMNRSPKAALSRIDRITMNTVRAQRGADYRRVSALTLRPSQDIGTVAAECYARQGSRSMGLLPALFTNLAQRGAPEGEFGPALGAGVLAAELHQLTGEAAVEEEVGRGRR